MLPHYAVLGSPVAHSWSPRIHQMFGEACGIDVVYVAIDTAKGFASTLERFLQAGGVGANVTAPDKQAAFALCRTLSSRARKAGSVNTLTWVGDQLDGDCTDGSGLLRDLRERRGLDLHEKRVLLLGAGGAARAVAPTLLEAGVAELVIANRTRAHAWDLADAQQAPERVKACVPDELEALGRFDLILHAASPEARLGDSLPLSLADAGSTIIDLNYGNRALGILSWAARTGCAQRADGLGMLVEQAADSFERWHGVRPGTDAVYARLRMAVGRSQAG